MTVFYNYGEIIANRYQIIATLGQGGIATTYRALDTNSNIEVAIKTISLKGISDWKQIELFEREAKILQQLDHPGIPQYIDYFEIDTKEDRYFHLVQQLAPGKSLYDLINDGWCPDEQEVTNIASLILKIIIYLQQLSPPIIHRDIKPQNIIRQENGEVFLVDFGAVPAVYQTTFNVQ
ncbi:protein kinase [Pleurocapsales cyanobacterium LEGE 06147]|nr:protein kinase [Pleurocapsales cyanobacterium LEGE 06147]